MTTPASPDSSPPVLRQTLGFWQVALYGLGSMLGAGVYALIGRAAGTMGSAVWLGFLAAMVAALLTGLSYACVGSRYPRAGGAAYVTHRAFSIPLLSYFVGIAVTMSGLTSMATGSQAIAENLLKAIGLDAGDWSVRFCAIGLVAMVGAIIYRGIRESMWVNILCTVVESAGLLFIIAVGAKFWGSADLMDIPAKADGTSAFLPLLVMQGAVLAFFSFIGFEDILNVSEEVKDPRRNVPRGLIAAMLMATLIYLAVAVTAVSVIPWQTLKDSKTPLMDVARVAAPWFSGIDSVFAVITIFAIGNTALLNYLMGSRLLYGMSTQGLLPAVLNRIHPVRQSPHVAIVVLFGIVSVLICTGGVKAMAEATVLLLLTVFTIVNLALVRLKFRKEEPRGGFEVPFIIPLLGAIVCTVLIIAKLNQALASPKWEDRASPLVALGIFTVALLLYFVLRPKDVLVKEDAE